MRWSSLLHILSFSSCLFLTIFCISCNNDAPSLNAEDKQRNTKLSNPNDIILDIPEDDNGTAIFKQLRKEKPTTFFQKWKYTVTSNEITVNVRANKEAALALLAHKLWIGFDDHIAKENPKTMKFVSTSPFSSMEESGIYSKPLIVNGKPFSGVLIGLNNKTGKKILEVNFYGGIRTGTFNVWTNLGRLYTKKILPPKTIIINSNAVRKPVVYLYPTKKQKTTVKVNFKGEIIHSYPKYSAENGWEVTALPNGQLVDEKNGKSYPYLFWEGENNYTYDMKDGFVVAGENTADFLDKTLAEMGLNRNETTDFITYWLPELERNKYNHIHFSTKEYTQNAPLEISPAPETLIRVFMVYRPLDYPIDIPAAKAPAAIQRNGFTVVEWGGKKANSFGSIQ